MSEESRVLSPQEIVVEGAVRLDSQLGNPLRTERGLCLKYEGQNTRGGHIGSSEAKLDLLEWLSNKLVGVRADALKRGNLQPPG
jgi:hypothetical protein